MNHREFHEIISICFIVTRTHSISTDSCISQKFLNIGEWAQPAFNQCNSGIDTVATCAHQNVVKRITFEHMPLTCMMQWCECIIICMRGRLRSVVKLMGTVAAAISIRRVAGGDCRWKIQEIRSYLLLMGCKSEKTRRASLVWFYD